MAWAEEAEEEGRTPLRRNQTRQLLRTLVRKAMADKAYSAAVAAVGRLMELDGLKQIKVEVSGQVEHNVKTMTTGDKRDRLEELMAKAAARSRQRAKANGANGSAAVDVVDDGDGESMH